jgi:hypothetical protein
MTLTYFDIAVAAGIQVSGLSVGEWTERDQRVAEIAAVEALKAWVRLKPEAKMTEAAGTEYPSG